MTDLEKCFAFLDEISKDIESVKGKPYLKNAMAAHLNAYCNKNSMSVTAYEVVNQWFDSSPLTHITLTSGNFAGTVLCGISRERAIASGHKLAHVPYSNSDKWFSTQNICPQCRSMWFSE
jgi:hypothetical protein